MKSLNPFIRLSIHLCVCDMIVIFVKNHEGDNLNPIFKKGFKRVYNNLHSTNTQFNTVCLTIAYKQNKNYKSYIYILI